MSVLIEVGGTLEVMNIEQIVDLIAAWSTLRCAKLPSKWLMWLDWRPEFGLSNDKSLLFPMQRVHPGFQSLRMLQRALHVATIVSYLRSLLFGP